MRFGFRPEIWVTCALRESFVGSIRSHCFSQFAIFWLTNCLDGT